MSLLTRNKEEQLDRASFVRENLVVHTVLVATRKHNAGTCRTQMQMSSLSGSSHRTVDLEGGMLVENLGCHRQCHDIGAGVQHTIRRHPSTHVYVYSPVISRLPML